MSRRTRRLWRRTAAYAALAAALAANATVLAAVGVRDRSAVELVAAVGTGYLSVIALCAAVSWAWAAGRATARGRTVRTGRPAMTAEQITEHRTFAQAEEDAHAAAMAAVAADPLPERSMPSNDGFTVPMPIVIAPHLIDRQAAGAAASLPWPWTPPAVEPGPVYMAEARYASAYAADGGCGPRHAGRAA